jgi:transposase-like protein
MNARVSGIGKYYTPEFKEQAVKMVVGLDCTYDLLHAL